MMEPVILVVDDDEGIRESLSGELVRAGYAPAAAADGREGAIAFRTYQPDLLLTDLAMPLGDGFEMERLAEIQDRLHQGSLVLPA